MKIELVSIGTELLISDILDTNLSYVARSLREVDVSLTCKVTVGDDLAMIVDALRVGLRRADAVLTIGGLGADEADFTEMALKQLIQETAVHAPADPPLLRTIGNEMLAQATGKVLTLDEHIIISLPGNRREITYLMENEVLPYLRHQRVDPTAVHSGWRLLRTVGIMESSLKQELADLTNGISHRLTFDSFAGQTNIRIWAEQDSVAHVQDELNRVQELVKSRLGDYIYGGEQDRLEQNVIEQLRQSTYKVSLLEFNTDAICTRTLRQIPESEEFCRFQHANQWQTIANEFDLEPLRDDNLVHWCRAVADQLVKRQAVDLGLIVFSNITQSGVQILVTLASPYGISVIQRSFGGHPDNINQWALTLALSHLRRWLLAYGEPALS